ncbi:LLM class flavin-dependent oxidoreductase [Actinokineospora sp. NBRC 105648]|uniref:LLM class flavin-dependent oxidoreductase n=1 Tax=Actinokineospora sp. NBRC 105648 TaxID=3032206 RepID=UPI0024A5B410|nr:LLM class flavin-dependent oxidoreductase [Actinokineospora sp. NBRC 105648]GLZ40817.1 FMN-linked alkanal monooxygenase [Actinokineospora sp. NBRC 105648]
MTEAVAVSVHDTVPVWRGDTAGDALRRTIDLAKAVDELGYRRYWVAEHHSTPALATSAPAVLAGQLLAATTTIRVGSGAVLLPNHSPLAVAEQFGVLASLYPGRVDLGLGRGAGGSAEAAARLGDPRGRDFADQYTELVDYLTAPGTGHRGVRAVPEPVTPPEFWMVGSSVGSAAFAGSLGLPYVYAHAIVPGPAAQALAAYRGAFRPSRWLAEPYAGVAAIIVAADSDARAQRLADAFVLGQIRMRTVDPATLLPTEEEAAAHRFTPQEDQFRRGRIDPQFVGSPATIGPRLRDLLRDTRADELFALTQVPDHDARVRSYELLAKVTASL